MNNFDFLLTLAYKCCMPEFRKQKIESDTLPILIKTDLDQELKHELIDWCSDVVAKIATQIKSNLAIYLQNNLQSKCPKCKYIKQCAEDRTRYILTDPELNSPSLVLYDKESLPENIKEYLRTHAKASVKQYDYFLLFKMPRHIDLHWDTLVKRALSQSKNADGKIILKLHAGPVELASLKLNAIIKNVFWNSTEAINKNKKSMFNLERINDRGEHCGEYYYLLALEAKSKQLKI